MKGYKGMKKDMTCRGMPFEVGKSYHVDGEIELCRNGLHFCERLSDVFEFYEKDDSRFFEINADGIIKSDGEKSVASDVVIVRELTKKEINRIYYGNGYGGGYGYGDGYGYGGGYGDGDGYGYGYGYGYGGGNGGGYGYGDGDGYGGGYGDGDGYGYGDGDGYGGGNGYGYGYGGYGDDNIQKILIFDN